MADSSTRSAPVRGVSYLYMAAAFVVVIAGMRSAAEIINPLLLAVFLSVVSAPAYFALLRRGVSNWASLGIVIGVLSIIVVSVVFVVMESIAGFTARHEYYQNLLDKRTTAIQDKIDGWIPDWAKSDDTESKTEDETPTKSDKAEVETGPDLTDDSVADQTDAPFAVDPEDSLADEGDSNARDGTPETADFPEESAAEQRPVDSGSVVDTLGSVAEAELNLDEAIAEAAITDEGTTESPAPDSTSNSFSLPAPEEEISQVRQGLRKLMSEQFNPGTLFSLVDWVTRSIGNLLSKALLILLTVIFILLETGTFTRKMKDAFSHTEQAAARGKEIIESIHDYVVIKTGVSLATGLLVAMWLRLLGVPYAGLWGLLAFLFNYIPNVGSFIAAIPALLIAWLELTTMKTIGTAVGFLVINITVGSFIEPRIMGRGLGLSPLIIFCSMVFWGWVLGPIGMLLSVPLTMTARIALDGFEDTKWIATLMGNAG